MAKEKRINRMWPTFLIIGAGRAGTSSLYSYLRQHPSIYLSRIKEPKFFASSEGDLNNRNEEGGVKEEAEYLRLFDDVSGYEHWGEASPAYLHHESSPRRIAETIPDVKMIAILRDPVERVYSHYGLNVRLGRRQEGEFGRWVRQAEPGDPFWEKYIVPGFYHEQLCRYYQHFGEEQFSIHLFEDFTAETERVVEEVFDFLEVDSSFEPDLSVQRNPSGVPRVRFLYRLMDGRQEPTSTLKGVVPGAIQRFFVKLRDHLLRDRAEMGARARQRLREIYRDDTLRLQNLLGRKLDHWG